MSLTAEEESAVEAYKRSLLAKRQPEDPRKCPVCKAFNIKGKLCKRCREQSEACAYACLTKGVPTEKTGKEVCRACINAGAGWCEMCLAPTDGAKRCNDCQRSKVAMSAGNFPMAPDHVTGVPDNAHTFIRVPHHAPMPAVSYDIPKG